MILFLAKGFSLETYKEGFKILPIMWVIVILLVRLVAGPLVGKIMPTFVGQTDSSNARVLLNTLLNVTTLSFCLSIIGTWVGQWEINAVPFKNFLHIWPRNFAIAFWIELLIAQPIARFGIKKIHIAQRKKAKQIAKVKASLI